MLCYNKSLHYISPRYAYTETKFISQEEYCNKISVLGSIGKKELNVARDVCLGVKLTQTKHVWLLTQNFGKTILIRFSVYIWTK